MTGPVTRLWLRSACARYFAVSIGLMSAFASCGRASQDQDPASTGGKLDAGGTPSGAVASGGASTRGKASPGMSTGGSMAGGASSGGISGGGTSPGGTLAGGTHTGGIAGASTGGKSVSGGTAGSAAGGLSGGNSAGGDSAGGDSAGGDSAGGSSGCIDVCALYGNACCAPALDCVKPGGRCVFEVFTTDVGVIYEYAALEQKVASSSQDKLLTFDDTDIERAFAEAPAPSRLELHLTAQASASYGAALAGAWAHPFRLSCDGEIQYLGVVYDIGGAAAIRTPVLHVAKADSGAVVLRIGAWQGAWLIAGPSDATLRQRIESVEFRAALCQRGALAVLDPNAKPTDP